MSSTESFRPDIAEIMQVMNKVVFGKSHIVQFVLISMICNDHILLEDVPGTGKTMLITTLSKLLDTDFSRIQGTPDLLPSDLTGATIYNQKSGEFSFMAGPIFTNILLFDEINRASPKTQAALLEAMAEGQVSIDTKSYKLPRPFFVMATQNPIEHIGTYPLPQAQLDRFLIKAALGYPTREEERAIMLQIDTDIEKHIQRKVSVESVLAWQDEFEKIEIKDELIEKLQTIIDKTRDKSVFILGISPRSAKKFVRALKASAYIHQRTFVTKDDIYDLFLPVMQHRVYAVRTGEESTLLQELLTAANF
jgi:MoxR-like ATPase